MTLSMTLSSQVLLLGDFSTALVFLAPPLGPWARESQLQVPVPHPEAPQLWPALTDCAMETDELSVLQEPQISRAEKRRRWGGGDERSPGPTPTGSSAGTWTQIAHMQSCSPLLHDGRLGRMCGRGPIFPPPFRVVCWFLWCTCERPGQPRRRKEEQILRWPKRTEKMKGR